MTDPAIIKRLNEQGLGATYYRIHPETGVVTCGVVTGLPFNPRDIMRPQQHLALNVLMAFEMSRDILQKREVRTDISVKDHRSTVDLLRRYKITPLQQLEEAWRQVSGNRFVRSHSEHDESTTISAEVVERITQLQYKSLDSAVYVPIFAWLDFMTTWTDADKVEHPVWIMKSKIAAVSCFFTEEQDDMTVDVSYQLTGGSLATVASVGREFCLTPGAARQFVGDKLLALRWTKDIAQKSFEAVPIVTAEEYVAQQRAKRKEAIKAASKRADLQPLAD